MSSIKAEGQCRVQDFLRGGRFNLYGQKYFSLLPQRTHKRGADTLIFRVCTFCPGIPPIRAFYISGVKAQYFKFDQGYI